MTNSIRTSQVNISPESNLSRYLQDIRKYPMLSQELEQHLACRWIYGHDHEAAAVLVNSHLRLVAKIAMGYRGYGLPVAELISEGNIGLMQSIHKFDPEKGFRLSTYAMWWIKAAIQEYILHSWSLVKMGTTAAQKKLFFNLRRIKSQMDAYEEGDLRPEQVEHIAHVLDVPADEVISMNRRMAGGDSSLNTPVSFEGDDEWQDWLADDSQSQEDTYSLHEELATRRSLLDGAMQNLSERERTILFERRLRDIPQTLENLSQSFGISRERVRQIEERAFTKVRKSVRNTVIEQHIAH